MVSCQNFKQWLVDQPIVDEDTLGKMMNHLQDCKSCDKLFQTDMALDQVVKNAMQPVEPPAGLIARAQQRATLEDRSESTGLGAMLWKTLTPALTMAALVLFVMLYPFSNQLQSVDEVAGHSIAHHMNPRMEKAYLSADGSHVVQRLSNKLGYAIHLPDLNRLGLKLVGGRKCSLGKVNAALVFCDSADKRASLIVVRQDDVDISFDNNRKYIVEDGDHKVTVWMESGWVYAMVV